MKSHPHCSFSTSQEHSCSKKMGEDYVCEVVRNIIRSCPGEYPVEVFRTTRNDVAAAQKKTWGNRSGVDNESRSIEENNNVQAFVGDAMNALKLFGVFATGGFGDESKDKMIGDIFKSFGRFNTDDTYMYEDKNRWNTPKEHEEIGLPPHIKARIIRGRRMDGPGEDM